MQKVAYTRRGKRLHIIDVPEDRRAGRTLCGAYGYVHPNFDTPETAVKMSLSFNFGCSRCLDKA